MSAWIKLLSVEGSTGKLKEAFEEAKTPSGTVDNVMRVHSHRPHTMLGHLALYRSVLHNSENDAGIALFIGPKGVSVVFDDGNSITRL